MRQRRGREDHGRTPVSCGDAATGSQALGHSDSQREQQRTRVHAQAASLPGPPGVRPEGNTTLTSNLLLTLKDNLPCLRLRSLNIFC